MTLMVQLYVFLYRNFDFKEKAQMDQYYPQYYHKIDKVSRPLSPVARSTGFCTPVSADNRHQ